MNISDGMVSEIFLAVSVKSEKTALANSALQT
jgi:hypothetical protein